MNGDIIFESQCDNPKIPKGRFLDSLTRFKARHGTRGLVALVALVGVSIAGYACAYGFLIYLS